MTVDDEKPDAGDGTRLVAWLHRETLGDWWRRFARERGMTLSAEDLKFLQQEDARQYPQAARQDAQRYAERHGRR